MPLRIVEDFTVLYHSPTLRKHKTNFSIDANPVDKADEHVECCIAQMAFTPTVQFEKNLLYRFACLSKE
jgi:hypothetical protein